MARILSIDYGKKKCGLATTDPLQIIVTGLDTVPTAELWDYLVQYMTDELVEAIILGKPSHADGTDTYLVKDIEAFAQKVNAKYSDVKIDYQDESFTSLQAKQIIFESGAKKKKRRDKNLIDKVSAVLILQKYLKHI